MADTKRKCQGTNSRKRKYRSDGTPLWSKPNIDGPGVWVSCVKGKEKQTVGELYDVFEAVAAELWPDDSEDVGSDDTERRDGDKADISIEDQIVNEVAIMKRPRKEKRFANCQTNTTCVVFISCKPPVDPVVLVTTHVRNVQETGVTGTRYTFRLVPVSNTCTANIPEIHSLCGRVFSSFFRKNPEKKHSYKIELRVRNHSTLDRATIIQEVARCLPDGHTVDLQNPSVFILVEVFKSVCGVSIVEDYYNLKKFNVMEIANEKKGEDNFGGNGDRGVDKQVEGSREGDGARHFPWLVG